MFSSKELDFLSVEIGKFVTRARQSLQEEGVTGLRREKLEQRLIMATSISNKLSQGKKKLQKVQDKVANKRPPRLLLIDDVESMRQVLKQVLLELGFTKIDMTDNGEKGLKLLQESANSNQPYDLVVSDWEMPKLSGLELLKLVRMDPILSATPFFLVTGVSDRQHIIKAIDTGVTGYLIKPVNPQLIKEKLDRFLVE